MTLENREAWFDAKRAAGFPVLAAATPRASWDSAPSASSAAWPGYRHSVEHSVHVRADCRGRGVGRALVQALLAGAARMQKHVMIAGIDAENVTSIALHEKLGFKTVGELQEVAFKFGRWLDLKFMHRGSFDIMRPW